MDYLTDIFVTSDKDIALDGANDIKTISGEEGLRQAVALDTMNATQEFIGEAVDASELGFLEQRVREFLAQDPRVDSVTRVTTQTFNRESNRVTMDVVVNRNESFTITLGGN